ncbi:MAG: universal stress protein [Haloarculaceae archaeon]
MKVLLGIGGSEDSFRALERTVERAAEAGDELTVAIVENPDSSPTADEVETRVREVLQAAGEDADVRRVSGHAGSKLVELAESEGYDQLVLGGGETSPLGKIQLGHIAEYVVLNAKTTVTLIR